MSAIGAELEKYRRQGVVLPRHPHRALESIYQGVQTGRELDKLAASDLRQMSVRLGRPVTADNYDSPEVQQIREHNAAMMRAMGESRALSSRMQRVAGAHAGMPDATASMPRWYDPMEFWDLSGLPWNVADEGHRHKLHKWLRLYYSTHYLIPHLVDIFTRFPLVGMELECKDPKLQALYEEVFFNQLNYEEFLVSLGREFWVVGEAFPLGSFDEGLGVWEREELINPEDVVIQNYPILGTTELKIRPPDYLKRLAQTKSPAKEWRMLDANFPELIPYLLKGEHIPISPVLMTQVGNKVNDWDDHGTPILLRGLRTLIHEEKLMASQDAVAERLYSPLILAKLGIQDMGDGQPPWLPGPEELESVRDDLDVALTSDFRVMVHHFGLEISSVFGREQMPRLGDDFDRIERRLMQLFGVNPSLLSAGSGGQPYASSALQAEFLNQILRTFQKMLKRHFRERALVMAEALEHQDYEMRGQTRIPLFEEIVEYDEEGNKTVREVPKLLIPDLKFKTLDLRDEATERQYLQSMRQIGIPIPDEKMMIGISWDYEDSIRQHFRELKFKTIEQQQSKYDTYTACTIKGLPIPSDLRAEVESVLQPSMTAPMGGAQPTPPGGTGPTAPGGLIMPNPPADLGGGELGPGGIGGTAPMGGPPPAGPMDAQRGSVPEISNERRPGLVYNTKTASEVDIDEVNWIEEGGELVQHAGVSPHFAGTKMREQLIAEGHSESDAEQLITTWLDFLFNRTSTVNAENLNSHIEAAILPETVEEDPTPVEEWELPHGFELRAATDKMPQRITQKRTKRAPRFKIDPTKKYSLVDPEAEPLDETEETSESEPEQSGSGAD